jgi:hypothetical protein
LAENSTGIDEFIRNVVAHTQNTGFNALRDQVKTYTTPFGGSELIKGHPSGF